MQWFDTIMSFAVFGGSAGGLVHLFIKKEEHRHQERMAEGERKHDRFLQQLKAISNAKNQSAIQRIRNSVNEWHDWEL